MADELLETSWYPDTLVTPLLALYQHDESQAQYGQSDSVSSFLDSRQLKALSIRPPLHPWFPYDPEQSTSCCSENEVSEFPASLQAPSTEPVVEKAQHDPHCPWFLTPVTAPYYLQSTLDLKLSVERFSSFLTLLALGLYPRQSLLNSDGVRSENWLMPL